MLHQTVMVPPGQGRDSFRKRKYALMAVRLQSNRISKIDHPAAAMESCLSWGPRFGSPPEAAVHGASNAPC